jgi:hypothetical protein
MKSVIQQIINSMSGGADINNNPQLLHSLQQPSNLLKNREEVSANPFEDIKGVTIANKKEHLKTVNPESILKFVKILQSKLNLNWTYRDIRRFLYRASRFIGWRKEDINLPDARVITASDIALSFVIPGPYQQLDRYVFEFKCIFRYIFVN